MSARVKVQCLVVRLETLPKWDQAFIVITMRQIILALMKRNRDITTLENIPTVSHTQSVIFPEVTIHTPHTQDSAKFWFDAYKDRRIINMYLEMDEETVP